MREEEEKEEKRGENKKKKWRVKVERVERRKE